MVRKKKGELFPELSDIETEMSQARGKEKYRQALKGTVGIVVVVAAVAVLIAVLLLPVVRITGTSMQPGLQAGDIVVINKSGKLQQGDVCAFYFNNKIILKRIIAMEKDIVEIDPEGHVTVNGTTLDEKNYITKYALGECDIEFPFVVPAGECFVMGDNRENSEDSRKANYGCIKTDEMLGKILVRVWPLNAFQFYGF